MVLFRGRYSDLIDADVHYLPLDKNFSNVDETIASLEDIQALQAMTERTYQDLVGSGRFGFRAYGRYLQTLIERKFDELHLTPRAGSTARLPSNRRERDDLLNEEPTDRPFGKARFDILQSRRQISVLEGEARRLSNAFDQASAAYLAETARLTEVCKTEVEHLWPGAVPATASLSLAQSSIEAACNRLTHFTKLCQDRRARFETKWNELSSQLPRDSDTESAPHATHRQRLAQLESEINNLRGEIDQLNMHGREAVAAAAGLVDTVTRCS